MLKQVLQEIENNNGPMDINDLSRKLGVDRTALEGMIRFWVQKGRLKDDAVHQSGATSMCSGGMCNGSCPGPDGCPFILKMPRTYSIAKKN